MQLDLTASYDNRLSRALLNLKPISDDCTQFNSNYESVWNVTAHGLKYADAHDLFLTPQCTAVITVMEPREYDLTEFGIETGWIMESYIQEIDLVTGELLFQWQASDHVDIKDTFWTLDITGDRGDSGSKITQSWDFFHINSVEKDWRGNYLISSRHLHSLLYVDGKTGMIHWTLGGRQNQFNDLSGGKATDIAWQHHARWANAELTAISVFDDRNCRFVHTTLVRLLRENTHASHRYIKSSDPVSRGVVIGLDYMTMTANVEADFHATSNIQSFRKGGMHYLENGNAVLGYGNEPGFTEFAHNGTVLWDVRFGPILKDRDTADNYRSLKVNWTGNPTWSPKIAAGIPLDFKDKIHKVHIDPDTTKDTAYFSWNGATKVAKWAVLASNDSPRLMSMAHMWCEVAKAGFETSVFVGNEARYIRAVAISGSDEVLGATPVLDMQDGSLKEEDWSALDFNAGWKQRQDGEYDAERDWLAEFKVMKDDWKRMKAATQRTIVATICGGLFAVSLVIGVLSWRFRDEWVGFFTKRVQRGKYQATADDDDNMSLGSSEAYDLDLNTGEFGMQQNPDCEALLSRNWKQDESPS